MSEKAAASRYSSRVFWSAEDEGYIAVCPEFEGLSAFGETAAEALAELQQAIELAVETYEESGWKLPSPFVNEEYSGQFRLRVSSSLHKWLAETAREEGVSLNSYVVQLLSEARGARRPALTGQILTKRPVDDLIIGPTSRDYFGSAVESREAGGPIGSGVKSASHLEKPPGTTRR